MANANSTGLAPDQRALARLEDEIDNGLTQLRAMLLHTHGNSGEAFRAMNDRLQDDYMWACMDKLRAIDAAWETLKTGGRQ